MEVHAAPAVGKRMWSYVRAALLMMRKGVLSNKRKLLLAMHLRRNKAVVARTLAALLSHHGHGSHGSTHALRRRDYEFSCTNTPDPNSGSSTRRLAYFPCLGAVAAHEDYDEYGGTLSLPDAEPPVARIDYCAAASPGFLLRDDLDLAPGEAAESESHEFACASPALVPPPGGSPCGCQTTRPRTKRAAPAARLWTTTRRSSSAASTTSSAARTPSRCSPTCTSTSPPRDLAGRLLDNLPVKHACC